MSDKRTLEILREAFDLSKRRKFEVKDSEGNLVTTLYFPAITRADRARATQRAGTDDAITVSTHMLCQLAQKEDGTKAFHPSDFASLQNDLPESVLNEIELFLFNVDPNANIENAKES
tara:strand:+ start:1446 stop:1799 length:354 start_codon:yes stop_codon:yes gene_type:complete